MARARPIARWLTAGVLVLGALAVGVAVAQLAYGLCNERIDPDGLAGTTCDALGGGESLAVIAVPPLVVLGAALAGRSRRAPAIAFAIVAIVGAAVAALIAVQA